MQLSKDPKFFAKEDIPVNPFLWNQAGPFLLLGAFTILIFKYAPFFSLLLLISFAGYAANLLWRKRGFYFSLMSLAAVSMYTIWSGAASPFWSSLLSASIALSWLLIYLGKQECETFFLDREEKIKILKENQHLLEKQLREVKTLETRVSDNRTMKIDPIKENKPVSSNIIPLREVKTSLETRVLDNEMMKIDPIKENKPVSSNIIPQEENDPQEKARLEHVQRQYALLREQFDEKSEALDQARKDLFRLENALLALQKIQDEQALEIPDEDKFLIQDLKNLEEECVDLEAQVLVLQEFISTLLSPKKRTVRSRKSLENQESLPLLIQEKIDQTIPSDSKIS